jgi:hypothetical protein
MSTREIPLRGPGGADQPPVPHGLRQSASAEAGPGKRVLSGEEARCSAPTKGEFTAHHPGADGKWSILPVGVHGPKHVPLSAISAGSSAPGRPASSATGVSGPAVLQVASSLSARQAAPAEAEDSVRAGAAPVAGEAVEGEDVKSEAGFRRNPENPDYPLLMWFCLLRQVVLPAISDILLRYVTETILPASPSARGRTA